MKHNKLLTSTILFTFPFVAVSNCLSCNTTQH